jgi:uncharacterized membrane protein (UPF0136 family)
MLTQYYYIFFGIVAIVGGALGYARAKSIPSVIAGGISGGLLILAGLIGPSGAAHWLALVVSLVTSDHHICANAKQCQPFQ